MEEVNKNRNANRREANSSRDSNNRIDAHNSSDDNTTSDVSFFYRDTENKKNIDKGKDNSNSIYKFQQQQGPKPQQK